MNSEFLKKLLEEIHSGNLSVADGLEKLKHLPFEDLGFAKLDTHRQLRRGFPEVVFCEGKTIEQSVEIISKLSQTNRVVLATRADEELHQALCKNIPAAIYNKLARTITVGEKPKPTTEKYIAVVTAGTSDIPVAEEAAVTAELMGVPVERIFDVGVAGIHRLMNYKNQLTQAGVIVVAAGMEGALASVIGGLVDCPVVAVPTSIGYGASFNGLAALLSMLNACAPGIAVVNIDNGFGAGYFAALTNLGNEK